MPVDAKSAIDAFLQQDPEEGLAVNAPEANSYEFQSGDVIEMLETLLDKFISDCMSLQNDELTSSRQRYMLQVTENDFVTCRQTRKWQRPTQGL